MQSHPPKSAKSKEPGGFAFTISGPGARDYIRKKSIKGCTWVDRYGGIAKCPGIPIGDKPIGSF